jgi:uncharacterized phage-like protein YoqJ
MVRRERNRFKVILGERKMIEVDKSKCCAFTGHRKLYDNFSEERLKNNIKNLIALGIDTFFDGMAMGFDLKAARCVLDLKEQFGNIKLIACIPCMGQEKYFPPELKEEYYKILSSCDCVEVLANKYYNGCMYLRDRFMVDNSDNILAYLHEDNGGTLYTVTYAHTKNKQIYIM